MGEEFCEVFVSRINAKKTDAGKIDQSILDLVNKMNLMELPPEIQYPPGTILLKCNDCKQTKSLDEFYANNSANNKKKRHGKQYICIVCCNRNDATPEGRSRFRKFHLKKSYGIDHAEYERMLAAQGGMCAICKTTDPGGYGMFHIDHDHVTGEIRGLLCTYCNTGLGYFKDIPLRLRAAADYLEKHAALQSQEK